jgi:hypothetical protein
MRLLTPFMFELEDLNSTNGSFVENTKLEPNKRYQFDSSARVRFGSDFNLNLKSIFPNIELIQNFEILHAPVKKLCQRPPLLEHRFRAPPCRTLQCHDDDDDDVETARSRASDPALTHIVIT